MAPFLSFQSLPFREIGWIRPKTDHSRVWLKPNSSYSSASLPILWPSDIIHCSIDTIGWGSSFSSLRNPWLCVKLAGSAPIAGHSQVGLKPHSSYSSASLLVLWTSGTNHCSIGTIGWNSSFSILPNHWLAVKLAGFAQSPVTSWSGMKPHSSYSSASLLILWTSDTNHCSIDTIGWDSFFSILPNHWLAVKLIGTAPFRTLFWSRMKPHSSYSSASLLILWTSDTNHCSIDTIGWERSFSNYPNRWFCWFFGHFGR